MKRQNRALGSTDLAGLQREASKGQPGSREQSGGGGWGGDQSGWSAREDGQTGRGRGQLWGLLTVLGPRCPGSEQLQGRVGLEA